MFPKRKLTASKRVEKQEPLEASALVGQLADSIEDEVNNFLADSVVASGEVVGGVLLPRDQQLWVKQLTVGASPYLVDHGGLEVNEYASGNVLASASLREEGVERVATATDGCVRWHSAIRCDAVFQTVKLPAGVANLGASLVRDVAVEIEAYDRGGKLMAG
jgi:hypothetical protein